MADEAKTTTWGDCGNPDCNFYGRMVYGIEPGDYCGQKREDAGLDADDYCYSELRWWDRWHDGKHSGYNRETGLAACTEQRRRDSIKPHTDDMVDLVRVLTAD